MGGNVESGAKVVEIVRYAREAIGKARQRAGEAQRTATGKSGGLFLTEAESASIKRLLPPNLCPLPNGMS